MSKTEIRTMTLLKLFFLGFASAVILGCSTLIVEGSSSIKNGIAQAYLIEEQSGKMVLTRKRVGAPARTDDEGRFWLLLPANQSPESVIVEVSTDLGSRMACNWKGGCADSVYDLVVEFGQNISLNQGFSMSGAVLATEPGAGYRVNVTPLSQLAIAHAGATQEGLTPESVVTSYRHVEAMMGLQTGALQLPITDLSELNLDSQVDEPALKVAVLSAAFLALTSLPDWGSVVEVLDQAAERIAQYGELAATNMGTLPDVALTELFYFAEEIARGMNAKVVNPELQDDLTRIAGELQSAQQVLISESDLVSPVVIIQQPVSASADEFESISFDVQASGGDHLSYRWRKDDKDIVGGNQSSLRFDQVKPGDEGNYYVIVSNSVGSVVSATVSLHVYQTVAAELAERNVAPPPIENSDDASGADQDPNHLVNADPLAVNDFATTDAQQVVSIFALMNDRDADGDPIMITSASAPNGSVVVENSEELRYQSISGFSGVDTITYWISDGNGGNATAKVLVTVNALAHPQAIELSWQIPTERENQEPLGLFEIKGYTIAYGTNVDDLDTQVFVEGPLAVSYRLNSLNTGRYYFAIATVDSSGVQGAYSDAISVMVQ